MQLILSTFGTSLNRDNEGFVVTQEKMRQRIPADDVSLIQISNAASITSDAVLLAMEKEIDVVFVDKTGKPQGRIWSPKYGSISTIRKGQLLFIQSKVAVSWIRDVIARKIANQQALIITLQSPDTTDDEIDRAIKRLDVYRQKVQALEGERIMDIAQTLRGWEGMASKIFFDAMNHFLPSYLRFIDRTQHPAMDAVNCFLK